MDEAERSTKGDDGRDDLGVHDDVGESDSLWLDFDKEFAVVPIVRRATFRFCGRASTSQTVVLADGLDVTRMRVGAMAFVVHERDRLANQANFDVRLQNVALSIEDPGLPCVDESRTVGITTVIGAVTPAVPYYQVVTLVQPIGPQLRALLVFRQGANETVDDETIVLSAYLISRTRL